MVISGPGKGLLCTLLQKWNIDASMETAFLPGSIHPRSVYGYN